MDTYEKCKAIILEAGKNLLEMHSLKMSVTEKTDYKNLVTSCDTATQDYLVTNLQNAIPNATFLCEEEGLSDTSGEFFFIIDPIDGTTNFVMDFMHSSISVALATKDKILWGIVYNPFRGELFEGKLGDGAFLNGKKIQVSEKPLLHSLAGFGTSPYYQELKDETFRLLPILMDYCMDVRRLGSAALDVCYIACGRMNLFFELLLSPWDYAAAKIILEEAGGVLLDMSGKVPDYTQKSSIVAGTREAADVFLRDVITK